MFNFSNLPFFYFFSIYKIFDSKHSTDDYKSSKIRTGAIIKNPEKLRLVFDYLKAKKNCKHAVNKLHFVIIYVPNQYKTEKCIKKLF